MFRHFQGMCRLLSRVLDAGGGVMERLTYRDKDGFPMMKKRGGFKQGGVERLAAYEDTGLTEI